MRDGLTFVAPYDDPHTIAGQGTIGDEILRQVCVVGAPSVCCYVMRLVVPSQLPFCDHCMPHRNIWVGLNAHEQQT